jgi:DNA-directed RNA polymerase subunit RPC12/RpoP
MTPTDDGLLHFACPQCQTRLKTPKALAGGRTRCPYCQMTIDVPWRPRSPWRDESYALQPQTNEPPAAEPVYLTLACPVCRTRLRPTEQEIGRTVLCPDCGTPLVVRRPSGLPPKKRPGPSPNLGEYALVTEIDRTDGATPAAELNYVAVVCPTCHTRLHATEDQVGRQLLCPDCGTPSVVPPMPPPRRKIDAMQGSDGGYAIVLDGPPPPPVPPPRLDQFDRHAVDDEPAVEAQPDQRPRRPPRRPPLPAWPFLNRTLSFPLSPGMRGRTFGLMGWAAAFSLLAWRSVQAGAVEDPGSWFASAALCAIAGVMAVMWLVVASACALAVVRDTANGCDKILSWPGPIFTDWLFDPLYLFGSLCLGSLPGAAAAWLLADEGVFGQWLAAVSTFLLLPVALLSMLENNSPFGIISVPLWRTFFVAPVRWLTFYAVSGAMLAAVGGAMALALFFGPVAATIADTVLLPLAWFAYFRLLGRLAWCCADATIRHEWQAEMDDQCEEDV